jgi:hypothetical protein
VYDVNILMYLLTKTIVVIPVTLVILKVQTSTCKLPVILVYVCFSANLNFLGRFNKILYAGNLIQPLWKLTALLLSVSFLTGSTRRYYESYSVLSPVYTVATAVKGVVKVLQDVIHHTLFLITWAHYNFLIGMLFLGTFA